MGMYEPHGKEFTRRHFLAGSGAVAAVAAGGAPYRSRPSSCVRSTGSFPQFAVRNQWSIG